MKIGPPELGGLAADRMTESQTCRLTIRVAKSERSRTSRVTFCVLGVFSLVCLSCQYQCKWLSGKARLRNDLLCVERDVKLTHSKEFWSTKQYNLVGWWYWVAGKVLIVCLMSHWPVEYWPGLHGQLKVSSILIFWNWTEPNHPLLCVVVSVVVMVVVV